MGSINHVINEMIFNMNVMWDDQIDAGKFKKVHSKISKLTSKWISYGRHSILLTQKCHIFIIFCINNTIIKTCCIIFVAITIWVAMTFFLLEFLHNFSTSYQKTLLFLYNLCWFSSLTWFWRHSDFSLFFSQLTFTYPAACVK